MFFAGFIGLFLRTNEAKFKKFVNFGFKFSF